MNIKIRKKLHKVIDLCLDAKDVGHDCFFEYNPNVERIDVFCYLDGWEEEKERGFNKHFYLDDADAEKNLDECIEYLEKLIDDSAFGKKGD